MLSKTKTIYDTGAGEIFWKNFLAGFSRGLGQIFVYLLILFIIGILFAYIVLPKIMPSVTFYTNILKSLSSLSNIKTDSGITIPKNLNIQKLLGQ